MKNFVKARDHDSAGFHYLSTKFKDIFTQAKVKVGVFNGPQILLILNYQDIVNTLNVSLGQFRGLTKNLLGHVRAQIMKSLWTTCYRELPSTQCSNVT